MACDACLLVPVPHQTLELHKVSSTPEFAVQSTELARVRENMPEAFNRRHFFEKDAQTPLIIHLGSSSPPWLRCRFQYGAPQVAGNFHPFGLFRHHGYGDVNVVMMLAPNHGACLSSHRGMHCMSRHVIAQEPVVDIGRHATNVVTGGACAPL
jgi:hypothetical protein